MTTVRECSLWECKPCFYKIRYSACVNTLTLPRKRIGMYTYTFDKNIKETNNGNNDGLIHVHSFNGLRNEAGMYKPLQV